MDHSEKKILFFGYYDDFANFFAKVAQRLQEEVPLVNSVFVTGFISGWLGWIRFAPRQERVFITLRLFALTQWYRLRYWQGIPPSAFRGYRPKPLLSYEFQSTGRYSGVAALLARIHVFDELFQKFSPSYLVVSGNSRVAPRVCIAVARKYGCKVGYFEQGPFGTSFLDSNGVNADLTVPVLPPDVPERTSLPAAPCRSAQMERRNIWFRGSDYVLSYLPGWPPEFQSRFVLKLFQTKRTNSSPTPVDRRPREFLFALQVPDDANFIIHSDFSDFETALRLTAAALPGDAVLAVREHPKYRGLYGAGVYDVIAKSPQLYLQQDISGSQALKRCEGVITLNSMMGLEALMAARPVFLLGRSYYEDLCHAPKLPHQSFVELQNFLSAPPRIDISKVAWFMEAFFQETAISGHFRDAGVSASSEFANKIRAQL